MFKSQATRITVLVAAVAACAVLLHVAGPGNFVLVYNFYFVILLAAYWYSVRGGALVGALSGLAASPFLIASTPSEYGAGAWAVRMGYFVSIGLVSGLMRRKLARRRLTLEANVTNLSRTYARTLEALTKLLESHDEETSGHCERVAYNALRLGERLGLRPRDLETLYWAGYLHDVGKLATPAKILLKAGPLTHEEYEVMKQHAAVGADTLMNINPEFHVISEAIRSHHERWDGRGYPRSLAGTQIPIFGRILAVVDAFEAMTSDRPYRAAMPTREASLILQEGAGSQFDPAIVEVHLQLLAEGILHTQKQNGEHTGMGLPEFFNAELLERVAS
ncbi:MAG: HD domain-containing protein [Truepera sp.]|jgi:putative nucleotidyltransferase with HDIG domain|nr:HD domain-containing protein [Truepera sp.]